MSPITPLPPAILERYKYVSIVRDVLFINAFFFLSKHINFITMQHITNGTDKTTLQCVKKHSTRVYAFCGFIMQEIFFDGKMLTIEPSIQAAQINPDIFPNNKHVRKVE